jgi:hypothetical protein
MHYFDYSPCVLDRDTQSLHPTFVEYIDGARLYLENEADKEVSAVRDIKLHFCNFIRKMIKSFSCKNLQDICILACVCVGLEGEGRKKVAVLLVVACINVMACLDTSQWCRKVYRHLIML